jgi:hypothetical protein
MSQIKFIRICLNKSFHREKKELEKHLCVFLYKKVFLKIKKCKALSFIIVKSQITCIAVLLYIGSIRAKSKKPYVNNGLDPRHNKAVNVAGQIVTSANIVG